MLNWTIDNIWWVIPSLGITIMIVCFIIVAILYLVFKENRNVLEAGVAFSGLSVLAVFTFFPFYIMDIKNAELAKTVTQEYKLDFNSQRVEHKSDTWQEITYKDSESKKPINILVKVIDWRTNTIEVSMPQIANIDYSLESLKR